MKKVLAASIIAVFSLHTFANGTLLPDYTPTPKAKVTKVKRTTLRRIVKYRIQHEDDKIILVDSLPAYGRNRNYYTWNKLVADELSDTIKLRLAISRLKALKKHQEIWG
jgi:hypothetical protein